MSDGADIDRGFELFLEKAFASLEHEDYEEHPAQQMLIDYIYEQADLLTLARISAHVATCRECSERVRALREERERAGKALAAHLGQHSRVATGAAVRVARGGFLKRVLVSPRLSSRRGFYGHLAAWATASGLVAFFLIRYLHQPVMVLESSGTPVTGGFMRDLLYGLAGALGLWGLTGLALHGYRALRRLEGRRPRGEDG